MTAYQYISSLLAALVLAGCCAPPPTSGDGGAPCTADPCPGPDSTPDAGVFPVCEQGATPTKCCQGGRALSACRMSAGILIQTSVCSSGLAAVSALGVTTCCDFSSPSNPCAQP